MDHQLYSQNSFFIHIIFMYIKITIKEFISIYYEFLIEDQKSEFENNFDLYTKIYHKTKQIYHIIKNYNGKITKFPILNNRSFLEKIEKKLDNFYKILYNESEIYECLKCNDKDLKFIPSDSNQIIFEINGNDFVNSNFTNLIAEKSEISYSNDNTLYSITIDNSSINEVIENECFDNDYSNENLTKIVNNFNFNKEQKQYFLSQKFLFNDKIIYDVKYENNIYFFFYNRILKFNIDKNNMIELSFSKEFDLFDYTPDFMLDIKFLILFFKIDYDNKIVHILKYNLNSDTIFNFEIKNENFFKQLILFSKIFNN